MKVITSLRENINLNNEDCFLTVGIFDGIHLGHQFLLNYLKEKAKNSLSCVITFSNSLKSNNNLLTIDEKLNFFNSIGIDSVILLKFTNNLSNTSYKDFLRKVKNSTRFTNLILGKGSAFGKNKEGTEDKIINMSDELKFSCEYIKKLIYRNEPISSSEIKKHILNKNFYFVKKMLGKPYHINLLSLYDHIEKYFLPPSGKYKIIIEQKKKKYSKYIKINAERKMVFIEDDNLDKNFPIKLIFQ